MPHVPDHVALETEGGLARLQLDRPPVNALNMALLAELRRTLRELADDDGVRGVLLGSAHPKAFSAGLDLPEISGYDGKELERFADLFLGTFEEMYGYPKPLVAALPGHTIAGGLLLAVTADARVAAQGDYKIVLSEVDLGIPVPRPEALVIRELVGAREARRVALEGREHDPATAREAGLVDQVVPPEELDAAASTHLRLLAEKDPTAYAQIKRALRSPVLDAMEAHRDEARQEALRVMRGG